MKMNGVRPIRRVVVVVAGENPSFDYYLAPRFALHPGPSVECLDVAIELCDLAARDWDGVLVILCRYVSRAWLRILSLNAHVLAGVVLFVDDDMEALASDRSNPVWYRRKLRRLAIDRWPHLIPLLTGVWVSTAPLAERWRARRPRILPPLAGAVDLDATPTPTAHPLVGLHATGSHKADQRWLSPVVRAVLAARPTVAFEVVADRGEASRWRGDPRLRVIPPLSWPAYRADTAAHGRDLLLAPMLPTWANAARASTKRIDAARCGAALLVSDAAIYEVSGDEAALGMAVSLDVDTWIDAILNFISDSGRRQALAALNRAYLVRARREDRPLFAAIGSLEGDTWRLT